MAIFQLAIIEKQLHELNTAAKQAPRLVYKFENIKGETFVRFSTTKFVYFLDEKVCSDLQVVQKSQFKTYINTIQREKHEVLILNCRN